MTDPRDNFAEGEPELPAALLAELRGVNPPAVDAKTLARLDDAVMSQARARFAAKPQASADTREVIASIGARRRWRIIGACAAMAAAVAIVVITYFPFTGSVPPKNFQGPIGLMKDGKEIQDGDINLDGRIDIVDAYLLQRQIDGGPKISLWDDLTGDGRLDQQDVNAIASTAVKLGGPRL